MRIALDRESRLPLYAQIEEFLRASIASGQLPVQTRLPSARTLAADLGLSRMTVETAYAGLEAEGLVRRDVGSGTFVMPLAQTTGVAAQRDPRAWPQWQMDLSSRCESWHAETPHAQFSFGVGSGDSRRFPVDELRKTMQSVMRKHGRDALGYGDARGYAPLRNTMAAILTSQGLRASAENVLITSGSQQALALVAQLLLQPGDCVLVERPTYGAALELFRAMAARVIDIPVDAEGMQVETLEPLLRRHRPKLIYTIPNFQNPTGACMTTMRRRALVALAERYGVAIFEDDFVGDLRYDGRAQPALKALDHTGGVIYASTFSKMLMPGLRIGMLLADGPVLELLAALKRLTDLATSNAVQRVLHAYVSVGRYDAHLRRSRRIYRVRRDEMANAIRRHFPAGTEFELPSGGLFLWARLPENISVSGVLARARQAGVSFAPGTDFFTSVREGDRSMRLNFAAFTPDEIDEGIRVLGKTLVTSKTWR